jgi:hypothetical protein
MLLSLSDTEQIWLLALLVVWVGLLFGGFIVGKENEDQTHRTPTKARMGSSIALVVAGWSWWIIAQDSDWQQLALLLAIGMSFGFLGDLFMAGLIIGGENRVLGGIGAFGIGHVAYIIGLVGYGNDYGLDDSTKRWGALVVWLIVGAVSWYFVVYRGAKEREIVHIVALPYALLLAATTAFATGLALQSGTFTLLAVGGALFLFSDLILAAQLFNDLHFRNIGDAVWFIYGPGQMLIVYAVAFSAMF